MKKKTLLIQSTGVVGAQIINPEGESHVDLYFGTTVSASYYGVIAPGDQVGDELIIRVLPNPFGNNEDGGQMLYLTGMPIDSLKQAPFNYIDNVGYQLVMPPPRMSDFVRPAMAILRWTGSGWIVSGATQNVTVLI